MERIIKGGETVSETSWFDEPCEDHLDATEAGGCLIMVLSILETLSEYDTIEDLKKDLTEMAANIEQKLRSNEVGRDMLDIINNAKEITYNGKEN